MPQGGSRRGLGGAMGAREIKSKGLDVKAHAKLEKDANRQPSEHELKLRAKVAATRERRRKRQQSEEVQGRKVLVAHEKAEKKLRRAMKLMSGMRCGRMSTSEDARMMRITKKGSGKTWRTSNTQGKAMNAMEGDEHRAAE